MSEENKKILTNIEAKWVKEVGNTITVTIPEVKGEFETNLEKLDKYIGYNIKIVLNYTLDSSSSFHLYFSKKIELKSLSIECDLKPSDNKYYGDTRLKISNNFIIKDLKAKELKLKNIEFNTKCDLFDIEVDKLIIDNCIFNDTFSITSMHYVENPIKRQFAKHILAKNIKFNSDLKCAYNIFETLDISKSEIIGSANFKNCDFQEIQSKEERKKNKEKTFHDFSEVVFKENAYFDNSTFDDFTAFHLCVFEKTASFYSTKFNIIPNFSPGDFKGILNINNTTWGEYGNLEFEAVRSVAKKAYGKNEKEEDELETTRNIKDSFRAIKNVLIQENDQLEAQKFHKAELYCRELELEKENKNFSTFIDSLLLKFYRNTSDHHTNFLKILNFTVFCIAVYAVCSFVFVDIYTATFFGESRFFCKNISRYVFLGLTLVLICLTIIVICYILKDYKYTRKSLICIILFVILILATPFIKLYYPNFARWLLLILVIIFLLLSLYFYNNKHKGRILFAFLFFCFSTIPALLSIVYFFSDKDKNYDLLFEITIPSIISIYFCLIVILPCLAKEKMLIQIRNCLLKIIYKRIKKRPKRPKKIYKFFMRISKIEYTKYIKCIKHITLVFKCLVWCIAAFVLYLSPQLINPFVGVFKSDEILSKNYFEKKLNDLNASEIMEISALLQNNTYLSFKNTNAEIINAKELIKQNLKDINIANSELNATIANLKEAKDLQEYLVNGIKSSSLVYSIILLLCLYSLTKTARKNSIVPI